VAPVISQGGVVNGANFGALIVPNSWATIVGTNLATTTATWNNAIVGGVLPTSLGGVTVDISGKPAYISYVSPTQINLLVPDIPTGLAQATVKNAGLTSNTANVVSTQYDIGFFVWPGNQPVATRLDFTYVARPGTFQGLNTVAAKPGEVIILWGTGFGPTTPAAPVGVLTPSNQTYSTSTLPTVSFTLVPATVYGAALAPGFAGLYQLAVQVPESLPDGDHQINAGIAGVLAGQGLVLAVKR
jgi:uncharacterized protein (TIGR03437 family)